MNLRTIKLSETYESENNSRGKDLKGPAFTDLVASVKEKGVLVPVIVRPKPKAGKEFEIVAGNRRFRAAAAAGLKEIPARVETLSDAEAQEIQIIENLQREDVHPLEEGQAYRKLVEESKYEVPSVAAKVGKSESYVRQRIFLTNLEAPVATAYRSGKMTDGHAVLIARLSSSDQLSALRYVTGAYDLSVSNLKEYIEREFYKPMEYQPWLKDDAALTAVGPCKECKPNVPTLFGAVKEGSCTDKKCWKRKISKYIAYRKVRNPDLVLITKDYSYRQEDGESKVLTAGNYEKVGPKDKCQHAIMGLVAQGQGLGSQIRICVSPECKTHGRRHSSSSSHGLTPAEKAKRDKESAAEKAREEKREQKEREEMAEALKKVKWPLTRKTLDVLLGLSFLGDGEIDQVGERRFPDTKPEKSENYVDWEVVLKKAAEKMTDAEKAQLLVEIMLTYGWNEEKKKKLIKAL